MRDRGHVPHNAGYGRCEIDTSVITIPHDDRDLREWRRNLREKGAAERAAREREEAARVASYGAPAQLALDFEAGATIAELAEEYGLNPRSVRALLLGQGVSTAKVRPLEAATPSKVADEYAGMSLDALAERYSTDRRTMRTWLEDHGIPVRAQGVKLGQADDAEEILAAWRTGKSGRQIAKEMRVGHNRVARIIREHKAAAMAA